MSFVRNTDQENNWLPKYSFCQKSQISEPIKESSPQYLFLFNEMLFDPESLMEFNL